MSIERATSPVQAFPARRLYSPCLCAKTRPYGQNTRTWAAYGAQARRGRQGKTKKAREKMENQNQNRAVKTNMEKICNTLSLEMYQLFDACGKHDGAYLEGGPYFFTERGSVKGMGSLRRAYWRPWQAAAWT